MNTILRNTIGAAVIAGVLLAIAFSPAIRADKHRVEDTFLINAAPEHLIDVEYYPAYNFQTDTIIVCFVDAASGRTGNCLDPSELLNQVIKSSNELKEWKVTHPDWFTTDDGDSI